MCILGWVSFVLAVLWLGCVCIDLRHKLRLSAVVIRIWRAENSRLRSLYSATRRDLDQTSVNLNEIQEADEAVRHKWEVYKLPSGNNIVVCVRCESVQTSMNAFLACKVEQSAKV